MNNIKAIRERCGKKQQECADALGITLRAWQGYEQGVREPRFELLIKIADMFGTTTDEILGRETGEPSPIQALTAQFNMSALEQEIVKGYLELPEDMRDGLMDFLEKAVAKVQAESKAEAEKAPTTPVEQSEPEVAEVAVAARSFGKNEKPLENQKLKKRPGAGSILDAPDYKAD